MRLPGAVTSYVGDQDPSAVGRAAAAASEKRLVRLLRCWGVRVVRVHVVAGMGEHEVAAAAAAAVNPFACVSITGSALGDPEHPQWSAGAEGEDVPIDGPAMEEEDAAAAVLIAAGAQEEDEDRDVRLNISRAAGGWLGRIKGGAWRQEILEEKYAEEEETLASEFEADMEHEAAAAAGQVEEAEEQDEDGEQEGEDEVAENGDGNDDGDGEDEDEGTQEEDEGDSEEQSGDPLGAMLEENEFGSSIAGFLLPGYKPLIAADLGIVMPESTVGNFVALLQEAPQPASGAGSTGDDGEGAVEDKDEDDDEGG